MTDQHPHTSAAMRTVALAEFLRVPCSEIQEHGASVRSHAGREFLVTPWPMADGQAIRLRPLGESFGMHITEILMEPA